MAIGYACKTMNVPCTDIRNCTLKYATEDKMLEIIKHNIASLSHIIDYNIANNIRLFRISSDLIPFGSSKVNLIPWWELFHEDLKIIGAKIKKSHMRVSMHPGQYTVLNSDKTDVVERAIDDLIYHTRVLDSLDLDSSHKIVLHIGGAYQDKKTSLRRFTTNYKLLDDSIKRRLVIENDDKIYNIHEVLETGTQCNIPVIFDNLHNKINPSEENLDEFDWIKLCKSTWREKDGKQKIHYSEQARNKKTGSHSDFIHIDPFLDFYNHLSDDIDIMLEVKDKNMSCLKCIHCTTKDLSRSSLEKEWDKYKYTVLERTPSLFHKISGLLQDENDLSPITFYRLIENSLDSEGSEQSYIEAAFYVWEELIEYVSEKEYNLFYLTLNKFKKGEVGLIGVKNYLRKIAGKYNQRDLINSYYFTL